MNCEICGHKGARLRHVTRTYGKGKNLVMIQNVPVISCRHCGESYLTAQTMRGIDHIKRHPKDLAVERKVRVAQFA